MSPSSHATVRQRGFSRLEQPARSPRCFSDLRVAIVGYGSIGQRHARNLAALGVRDCVLVRRRESNPAFVHAPEMRVVHDHASAIQHGLDLAIVANPTSSHAQTALEFLEARVPVLVEKPIAHDLPTALALVERAEALGVPASVAYCLRYHPAYRRAIQEIQAGTLGRVFQAKAWFESYLPDWHPWEDYRQSYAARRELGGGALLTLDHELDFVHACLGVPIETTGLAARSGTLELDVEDLATVGLRFARGTLASVQLSLCRRDRSRGFEFVGERGTLAFRWEVGRLMFRSAEDARESPWWEGADYDVNQMYRDLLRDQLDFLTDPGRAAPCVPLAAGLAALAAAARVSREVDGHLDSHS